MAASGWMVCLLTMQVVRMGCHAPTAGPSGATLHFHHPVLEQHLVQDEQRKVNLIGSGRIEGPNGSTELKH